MERKYPLDTSESDELKLLGVDIGESNFYSNIFIKRIKFTSLKSKEISTIDYFVEFKTGEIGAIKYYITAKNNVFAFAQIYSINDSVDHLKEIQSTQTNKLFNIRRFRINFYI